MEILKFLNISADGEPDISLVLPSEKVVEIPDYSFCRLLVTDVTLPKGAKSPKEGIVVNFLISGMLEDETEGFKDLIITNGNSVEFPYGKKGLYVNHKVTPDTFSKMNYIIRINNKSHTVKLPDEFQRFDDELAAKFFLTVVSFRFGLSEYIQKGMLFNAFVYRNSRGYLEASIYDRMNKTYLPTPTPFSWLGGSKEKAGELADMVVREYWNSKTNSKGGGSNSAVEIDEKLAQVLLK